MSGDTRRSSRVRATNAVYNYSSDVDEEESDATPSRRTNRAQRSSQPQSQRGNWTPEEDHQLERLVNEYGPQHWSEIAKHLPPRAGKQCRERWVNFLDPSILKGDWTDQEDELLVQLKVRHGNHWADMSKEMRQEGYHRTDNAIKNRWNSSMKRQKLLWLKAMGVDISAYQESSVADLNQLVRSVVLSAPPPTGSPARSARSNSRHGSGSGKRRRTQGIAQGLMSMVPVVAQFSLEGEDEKTANNDTPNYTNNGNTATTTAATTTNNNNSKNSKNSDISDDENDDSNFCDDDDDDDDDDDNEDDSDNENGINDDINNNNNNTNNFVYKLNRQEPIKNLPRNNDEKSGFNYPNLLVNTTTPMSMNEHAAAADNLLNSLSATPLIPGIATHHSSSSSSLSTGISLSNMHYRSGEELYSGLSYLRYEKSKPSTYTPNSIPHSSSMLVPLTTSTTALNNINNISRTTSINNPTTTASTTLSTKTTTLSQTISRNISQSTPGPTLSGGAQQNYRLSPSLSALSVSMFPNSLQNQSLSSPVNNLSQLSSVDTPVYTTNAYRLTATNSIPPPTSTNGCTTDIGMSKHTVGLRSPCTVDRNIDRNLLSLGQSSATQQLPRNATTASSFSRPSPAMLTARNVNSPFYTSSSLRWNDHPAVATTATTTNTTTAATTAPTTAAITAPTTAATTAPTTATTATTATTTTTANTTATTTTASTTTMAATTANTTSATTSSFKHVPHPPMNHPSMNMNPRFHGSMLTQCTLSPHSLTPIKARPVSQLQVPPSAFVPGKSNELLSFPSLNGINDNNNNNINSNTNNNTNNNSNNNNKNNNNDTNSNTNNKNNNNDTNSNNNSNNNNSNNSINNNNNTNNNNTNDTIKNIKRIASTTTSTTVVPGTINITSTNLAPTPANSGVYYNTPKTIMLTGLPPDSIDIKPQQNILQRSQLAGCTPTDMDLMNKAIENYLKNPKSLVQAPTTIGGVSTPLFAKAMGVRSSYVPSQITQNKQTNLKSKQDAVQKAQFMSKHSLYIPPSIPPSSIPPPSLIQPYIPPLSSIHTSYIHTPSIHTPSIRPSASPPSSPVLVRSNRIPLPPLPPSHPSLRTFSRHIPLHLKTIHRSDSVKTEFSSITEDHSAYREENRLHQENSPSVVMVTPIKRAKPNNYNSVQSACNPSLQMVSLQSVNQTSFDMFQTCHSTDDDNDTVLATKSIAVTKKNDTSYLSPHTRNTSSPSIIQSSTAIPTSLNH